MTATAVPENWPHRHASRRVRCGNICWHLQEMGAGPILLLLHGAGGTTHSFRHLMPLLSRHYRVIALDLPGQGFTEKARSAPCGLDNIAADVAALAAQEGWSPRAVLGHSAGAAIALRLSQTLPIKAVIGINAALGNFEGVAGWLFPAMARFLTLLPFVPQIFSTFIGTPRQAHQLLTSTGSQIEPEGEAQYLQLLRTPSHIEATLAMMAQWNLAPLLAQLPQLTCPCLLITSGGDLAVPPVISDRAAALIPNARRIDIAKFGHLVHEEAPELIAAEIVEFLDLCQTAEDTGQ